MNINETYEFLDNFAMFSRKSGHTEFLKLLMRLNNPHLNLKVVHVAGTNGKGSTSTMISNILIESGLNTGLFISPFVLEFRERIQLNGELISEDDLCICASLVKDKLEGGRYGYFEIVTAIAFLYYKMKKCDVIVLEVGLGGRLDSTNVISTPLVSVITSISLDHTAILGDTIEQIAYEKAGIIKGGYAVLYPLLDQRALYVIKQQCKKTNTEILIPHLDKLEIFDDQFFQKFCYKNLIFHKKLLGKFQIYNALCAIEVSLRLKNDGYNITDKSIINGINNTFFPARMEVLSETPFILLDGAHNYSGSVVLSEVISSLNCKKVNVIIGVLKTKDANSIMETILPLANCVIVVSPNNKKSLDVMELEELAQKYCSNVHSFSNCKDALDFGKQITNNDDALVICGSLYLATDMRKLLK
ncbi:hypothetical protein AN641_07650 [Candidatus Epulonipiscioides gigas]|nr:hypothetical protein AN641_07650 [Epulopiscium sp. SCG-C07WGA-EpuloA2]